ncbi:MAG: Fic family protein, partial [Magnetococcales bacterium]|nr:Fic family protein [Magnetococcales bacterium]
KGEQIGIVFATATPFDTPRLMTELIVWFQDDLQAHNLHPLLRIGIWVVVFLQIHPFQDGNGRLSRVLTTLLLLQAGYHHVPYSSLESIIEANKEAYYLALRQTQGTIQTDAPNWQPWLLFFLRALAEQARRLDKKIEQEQLFQVALPKLAMQIVAYTREQGRITMGEACQVTRTSRHTLKLHFRSLLGMGYLVRHGKGRGVWYELSPGDHFSVDLVGKGIIPTGENRLWMR